jgi:hypothetical protein
LSNPANTSTTVGGRDSVVDVAAPPFVVVEAVVVVAAVDVVDGSTVELTVLSVALMY